MSAVAALGGTLCASALTAVGVWRLSLRLRDAGIVDVLWGYGFAALALLAFLASESGGPRSSLLLAGVWLWSLRLGTHLWLRGLGREEDFRYQQMRSHHGAAFSRRSLWTVFVFQAAVQWVLSLPLQLALLWPGSRPLGALDALGIALFAVGWLVETIADGQLERFRRDPEQRGRVLDRGLWRYSRHPNYFGECLIAWGLCAVAAGAPVGGFAALSPAVLTFLLLRVSGIPPLEAGLLARRPGYGDYVARTRAFLPGPPRALPADPAAKGEVSESA